MFDLQAPFQPSGDQPHLVILGGPNGAGKTTGALSILPQEFHIAHFLNADLIARGLSPFDPTLADYDAARMMLTRMRELRQQRTSFALETTLASKSLVRFVRECKIKGYAVRLIYVSLDGPETAVRRVAIRVAKGGHDIPDETVRRRFFRSLHHFFHLYRDVVDHWTLLDNSSECPETVALGGSTQESVVLAPDRYAILKELSNHVY